MKVKALNISRREFRGLLAENYGKPGEPSGQPWFGEGRFVQHLAVDLNIMVAFCGRDISSINSHPIRTLIGITCPACIRVLKRINRRIEAEGDASAARQGENSAAPHT